MKTDRILVPIDFSAHSTRALETALELVRDSAGTITLLHVGTLPYVAASDIGWDAIFRDHAEDLFDRLEAEHNARLKELADEVLPEPVERRLIVRIGHPATVICELAAAHDLIVMGTHGRGALGRAWLGSVTTQVCAQAKVPVLVVH